MALATLSIDIEARLARFEQGMARSESLLQKLAKSATTAGQRVGEIFAGNFAANIASDALNKLVGLFPQVVDGVLAIKDLAESTGSTIENISALDDIARRAGGSLASVEQVLLKFNQSLKDADGANKISRALQAVGLSAEELRKLDPAEALQRAAVAITAYADDGNRARLTQELFGKGVKDAATFLRDLADAGKLNATVTGDQVEVIDRFNKNLARLRTNVQEAGRSIANTVVPAINELFDAFDGKGPGALNEYLAVPLQAATVFGANVAFVLKGVGREIGGIAAQAGAFLSGDFKGARAIGEAMREDAAKAREEFDALERRLLQIGSVPKAEFSNEGRSRSRAPELPKLGALVDAAKLKEAARSFEDYQQTLTKGLADLAQRTPTVQLAELNAQLAKLDELAAAGLDPTIVRQIREALLPPAGANAGPPISEELTRVNELLKQTDSARLNQASRDAAALRDEMSRTVQGTQRWQELTEALIDVETEIDKLTGMLPELVDASAESAQQLRNTIEGALGSTISTVLRGEFKSIGDLWRNLLIDMASRAIAADLLGSLFGNSGGNGSGATSSVIVGGLLKLFGSAKGNAFGPSGLIPFATGGIVDRITPFTFGNGKRGVMGEAGPEAILPLKRGPGGRLGVVATGASGGTTVITNVTYQAAVNRNEVAAAMAIAERRAVASIADATRRGRLQPA